MALIAVVSGVAVIGSINAWAGVIVTPITPTPITPITPTPITPTIIPPGPTTSFTGVSETAVGIGLRFEFGDNVPEVVGTVRQTYTDTSNTVTGGLAELAIPLSKKVHFAPKIRAMGLFGSTVVQGEAGIGYDFAHKQPLIGVGIQGPYVEGGANYLFDGEFHPYVGVDTFGSAPSRATVVTQPPPTAA